MKCRSYHWAPYKKFDPTFQSWWVWAKPKNFDPTFLKLVAPKGKNFFENRHKKNGQASISERLPVGDGCYYRKSQPAFPSLRDGGLVGSGWGVGSGW